MNYHFSEHFQAPQQAYVGMRVSHIDEVVMKQIAQQVYLGTSSKVAQEIVDLANQHHALVNKMIAHAEAVKEQYPWGSLSK